MESDKQKNGNKMKIYLLITLGALAVVLSGISALICTPGFITPEITGAGGTEIISIENDSTIIDLTVYYENKNPLSATLSSLSTEIYHDKKLIGTARSSSEIKLQAAGSGSFLLRTTLETPLVAGLIAENKDSLTLQLKGSAVAGFGAVKVPLYISKELILPFRKHLDSLYSRALSQEKLITVKSASLKSIGLTESELEINFELSNPYGLDITLIDYPSKVYINNSYSGDGHLPGEMLLKGKSKGAAGVFVFRLNNLSATVNVLKGLFGGSIEYETKGTLRLIVTGTNIELPFSHKSRAY